MDGTSDFGIGLWPAIVLAIGWAYLLVSEERRKHNNGRPTLAPASETSKAIADLRSPIMPSPASRARQTFDEPQFLREASAAYEFILTRYAAGDMQQLANLLEPEVLAAFSAEDARRASAGETMALEFVALDSSEIVDSDFDDTMATIRVKFKSELFLSEDRIAAGGGTAATTFLRAIDIWTFHREYSSASSVWMLAATDSE